MKEFISEEKIKAEDYEKIANEYGLVSFTLENPDTFEEFLYFQDKKKKVFLKMTVESIQDLKFHMNDDEIVVYIKELLEEAGCKKWNM